MAIGGKLTKLKSVLKRLPSFNNKTSSTTTATRHHVTVTSAAVSDESTANLHPVYVGKTRRRYLISSDMIDHPLFKELAERSNHDDDDHHHHTINVSCEVVLFEHLLWMLENADPQPESLSELVEFYSC
ncbi:hypothetical protein ACFE04_018568 [Oxalis oulophora]